MNTNNLELKKLVYLYIVHYAKAQPELAILAVNTFVRDAASLNPLIRALAIRTMGCIRVQKITEYLCAPLQSSLKDPDPYVRKTAAVCVAKLFDINAQLVVEQGFIDTLRELLSDSTPMVVSNAVAALTEIEETSEALGITTTGEISNDRSGSFLTTQNVTKLLAALNECTEWGQVFILTALAKYTPRDGREAENIAERVAPRLQHANSAVVLGAVKVLMKYMDIIQTPDVIKGLCRKMSPPLVTLLSKEPEIQYVALRNIDLILQKRPNILQNEMKVFFCKYNDPIYVKMEKLEIIIMLCSEKNAQQVVLELKEYAQEVDVEFVRRAVRAIGRCAIQHESIAELCVQSLLELIQTKINYVLQEAVIVIKDIFRKYPNKYEKIISTLCENLESLDEPEAKASMVWIIGEYAERIENADELLESFLENFKDENPPVQLQILTGIVKLFLKRPRNTQRLVEQVLKLTEESDNADLRDRGFIYWRLLARDPEAAKAVVLSEKPPITEATNSFPPSYLNELLRNISTLSSVYHKPPSSFVSKLKPLGNLNGAAIQLNGSLEDLTASNAPQTNAGETGGNLVDLSDLNINSNPSTPTTPQASSGDLLLSWEKGKGLVLYGSFKRINSSMLFNLTLVNQSPTPMSAFAIQFNKNSFGLTPSSAQVPVASLMAGQSSECSIPLLINQAQFLPGAPPSPFLQVAFKNNIEVFYFEVQVPLHIFFVEDGRLDRDPYLETWRAIPEEHERLFTLRPNATTPGIDVEQVQTKLQSFNIFFTARRQVQDSYGQTQVVLYLALKTVFGTTFLVELSIAPQSRSGRVCVKTKNSELVTLFLDWIETVLS